MKSYQQYCSIARALDAVGDRWVLLIVRELLALGPSRYSDLRRGLPGVASNILAERLKTMAADGLIERHQAPAAIGAGVYQLTPRGRELEEVLRALSRWGLPMMPTGPSGQDAVQPQWSALLAGLTLQSKLRGGAEVVIGIDSGGESVRAVVRADGFAIDRDLGKGADVTLCGPALLVGGVLSGHLSVEQATQLGLTTSGRSDLLSELFVNHGQTGGTP